MRRNDCECLNVKWLHKHAENRVFAPNISVVENNSVVLAIDCCVFSDLMLTKEGHTPYRGVPFL